MLQKFIRWLRGFGTIGTAIGTIVLFLTTSWAVAVSAAAALTAALWGGATSFFENHQVQVGIWMFLVTLWTLVGILYLVDRKRPRTTQPYPDYRFGLVFEGFNPNFVATNSGQPDPGSLNFLIQLRNFSSGPIRYTLESLVIQFGTRSIPKYKTNEVSGYLARGSGRQARGQPFLADHIKEFYGKGLINGVAEFTVTYGPPEGPPVRRLKVEMALFLTIPQDGVVDHQRGMMVGWGANIISEKDEAIDSRA